MTRLLIFAALLLASSVWVTAGQAAAGQAAAAPPSPEDVAGRAVLEKVCSACHEASQVDGGLRTPGDWADVLNTMVSFGATGTDAQFAEITAYLLRNLGKANVNTTPAKELAPILDVTVPVAEAVVKYRTDNGPLKTIEDLKKVEGIDGEKLEARKSRLMF